MRKFFFMCGITGFYSIKHNEFASKDELKAMTDCIGHRGPDAQGHYYNDYVGLGHRRLSILDLSTDANQPMESHSMRYICVFNGEIYNFMDIAAELNIELKTSCDTEVVVEAFAEWGITFINKLNGIFSICIYDKQERVMYLFRDRLGIKPLFYYWDGENFAFSSEIKSLLKIKKIRDNRQLNNIAISEFLNLGFIPEPDTIYSGIKKFPSGEVGIISEKGFRTETFWDVEGIIRRNTINDYEEAKQRIRETIESSVKMQLISDVPYGTFLSGGIDSSLVTAVAAKVCNGKLNTFSIGFADRVHDESEYAQKVAEYLGTEHHKYIVTEDDAKELIGDMLDFYDEPFADSSAIPTMMVSRLAKKDVSMVLSGDGGDELFHGYGAYIWAKRMHSLEPIKQMIGDLLSVSPSDRYKRASYIFKYKNKEHLKSHIFSQEQYLFSELELAKLLNGNIFVDTGVEQDYSNYVRKLTPEEAQAIFDIRYYLKDDLLVKVDRASMKYSLEVRVPLLDHRLVELALNINPKFKISNGVQKFILKDILYSYVPKEFFDRKKSGFSIPLERWLHTDLSYLVNDYLNEDIVRRYNLVNYSEVQKLVKKFRAGHGFLYNRIWALIVLHKFMVNNEKV